MKLSHYHIVMRSLSSNEKFKWSLDYLPWEQNVMGRTEGRGGNTDKFYNNKIKKKLIMDPLVLIQMLYDSPQSFYII